MSHDAKRVFLDTLQTALLAHAEAVLTNSGHWETTARDGRALILEALRAYEIAIRADERARVTGAAA
jgi:hypothetical protein